MTKNNKSPLIEVQRDPVAFILKVLINPETDRPFELYPAEMEFCAPGSLPGPMAHCPFLSCYSPLPKNQGKRRSLRWRPCT